MVKCRLEVPGISKTRRPETPQQYLEGNHHEKAPWWGVVVPAKRE